MHQSLSPHEIETLLGDVADLRERVADLERQMNATDCPECGGNGFLLTFVDASYIEVPCTCMEEA